MEKIKPIITCLGDPDEDWKVQKLEPIIKIGKKPTLVYAHVSEERKKQAHKRFHVQ